MLHVLTSHTCKTKNKTKNNEAMTFICFIYFFQLFLCLYSKVFFQEHWEVNLRKTNLSIVLFCLINCRTQVLYMVYFIVKLACVHFKASRFFIKITYSVFLIIRLCNSSSIYCNLWSISYLIFSTYLSV